MEPMQLTDPVDRASVEEAFHHGFGPSTIAMRLRLPHAVVTRWLKSQGLTRTKPEAQKAYVNRTPEEKLPWKLKRRSK